MNSAPGIFQQIFRGVELCDLARIKDQDLVAVHNGLEAVCDGEDGAVLELLSDGRLDEVVRFEVDGRGGLVQH